MFEPKVLQCHFIVKKGQIYPNEKYISKSISQIVSSKLMQSLTWSSAPENPKLSLYNWLCGERVSHIDHHNG